MRSVTQAINQFCSYFEREIDEISRLVVAGGIADESSPDSGPLYRKVLYVTMLDTLAGIRFNKKSYPELAKHNRARFSRFVLEHCSWQEAELTSLPFLFEKLKEKKIEDRPLGKFVSEKLSRFSTDDGGSVSAADMDEPSAALMQYAASEKEEVAISAYEHIALLYRYRNQLVHESREPGYAMEAFADRAAPYYHGYLNRTDWYLGYPVGMFKRLAQNGIGGFRASRGQPRRTGTSKSGFHSSEVRVDSDTRGIQRRNRRSSSL